MKIKKALDNSVSNSLVALSLIGFLNGCGTDSTSENRIPYNAFGETIYGKPISVSSIGAHNNNVSQLAIVLDNSRNGGQLICTTPSILKTGSWRDYNSAIVQAEALIKAEIEDGDNETIEIYGYHKSHPYIHSNGNNTPFDISSIRVGGYYITF